MCNCVPAEVLRQCSAANPADIYLPSMTVLHVYRLKNNPILYFMPILTSLCVYYINTS